MKRFASLALFAGALCAADVRAEPAAHPPPADTRCTVDVRSIKGLAPHEDNYAKELEVGDFIADLKEQLEPLPFSRSQTLSHERQQVPLLEKAIFRVKSARAKVNTVFVEVECVSESGAQLQIDWNSDDGKNILSTQLRLMNGKSWVLGTDHEDKSSTIVSIKVDCVENSGRAAE